jgi:predicted O-linked N-acetylglucosamine transferase (SPINDLY family)
MCRFYFLERMIPNIVHFIYDNDSKKDFLFIHYMSVLSCKVINNPDVMYLYYKQIPQGYWWKKTEEICETSPFFEMINDSLVIRLMKLKEMGGICLDINTICVSNYAKLLENKCVISYSDITSHNNPIMMAQPNNSSINDWIKAKETFLPLDVSNVTVLEPSTFLLDNTRMIFEESYTIPDELIILSFITDSEKYSNQITNFDWMIEHLDTVYGKILLNTLNNMDKEKEIVTPKTSVPSKYTDNIEFLMMFGTMEGQHRISLQKINAFYKRILHKKKSFHIEDFDDFCCAYKNCNSIGLCSILVQIITNCYFLFDNQKQIQKHREYYQKMMSFMLTYAGTLYQNINILSTFITRNNAYAYSYHDESNVDIFKTIAKLQHTLCPDLLYDSVSTRVHKKDSSRIKVGFISDVLVTFHSVSKDRLGIIKHLSDDPEFDVKIMTRNKDICPFYTTIMDNNAFNTLIYLDTDDLSVNRTQIANEQFDIIVYPEIGMCSRTRWLSFSRLAPVQINTWGHSDTSGIETIDYFVSSKMFNTKKDQSHYTEQLILFDSLGTYYYDIFNLFPNEIGIDKYKNHSHTNDLRKEIIESTGISCPTIYGCIQIFLKMHPAFIEMLNDIIKNDNNAVIVLLSSEKCSSNDELFTKYIHNKINKITRVHFIHQAPFMKYAENIINCDIILDYYPFGGFNSTIETFLLGKICITRPGKRISGNFTQGLYKKMGITEFICNSAKEYVDKAIQYANNQEERKKYETIIINNTHKIIEEKESVREWKSFLKKCKKNIPV